VDLFGSEHPQILYSKGILAASYNLQGLFDEAVALGRERLDLIRRELGEDHPDVAGPFSDLGDFLQDQGKYEEALDLFHKALSIHEKTLGPLHPTILKTRNSIGICSSEMTGDLGEAEDFTRRLIQDYESVGD
jgi:tetratricopeptide (TPR) repeat protein